jgi:hypothetical protein
MDRVKFGGFSAAIEAAYRLIPSTMHDLIRPHFLCGTDPVFAGLHDYLDIVDGRSYRDTAHVAWEFQQRLPRAHRRTTLVLPTSPSMPVMVHELGHVLDERLGFEPEAMSVTWYGQTNRYEAFAEAFTAWVLPYGHGYGEAKDLLHEQDARTVALFEGLTAPKQYP